MTRPTCSAATPSTNSFSSVFPSKQQAKWGEKSPPGVIPKILASSPVLAQICRDSLKTTNKNPRKQGNNSSKFSSNHSSQVFGSPSKCIFTTHVFVILTRVCRDHKGQGSVSPISL